MCLNKIHELLTPREHQSSPGCLVRSVRVAHLFIFLSCVLFFVFIRVITKLPNSEQSLYYVLYTIMPVSLDSKLLNILSVFSNVYLEPAVKLNSIAFVIIIHFSDVTLLFEHWIMFKNLVYSFVLEYMNFNLLLI